MIKRINDIDRQAAEWVARTDGVEPSAALLRALDDWLAEDPRHLGAYLKVKAVMARVQRCAPVLAADRVIAFQKRPFARRRILMVGAIAASIAALALSFGPSLRQTPAETYTTKIGESRIVWLSDGSSVTMNTASKVIVQYSADKRSIALEQGEAIFAVAKNKERPFVVETKGVSVRAIGTRFAVRSLADRPVEVLVVEGTVRLDRQSAPLVTALHANSRAFVSRDGRVATDSISPADVSQMLAWRSGHIFFRHQTLAWAAQEFARYNRTAVIIDDPAIAQLTVTGSFLADDPIGFAKAVSITFDLKAVVGDNQVRLTRAKH